MKDITVFCVKTHPEAKIPQFATEDSAGVDLYSIEETTLLSGERKIISTGLKIALEPSPDLKKLGYKAEMQIRPRSGLAATLGITIVNAPGTIDQDYRGVVKIILLNTSDKLVFISKGERIAQAVVDLLPPVEFLEAKELSDTERGEGGLGSTGRF